MYSQEVNEQFGEKLVGGLSTKKSYVVLRQSPRSGVRLQFRPLVMNMGDDVFFIGGKLAAFWMRDTTKNEELSQDEAEQKLQNSYKKLKATRSNCRRVANTTGVLIKVEKGDAVSIIEAFSSNGQMSKILSKIEEELDIEIDDKRTVRNALLAIFEELLTHHLPKVGRKKIADYSMSGLLEYNSSYGEKQKLLAAA